MKTWVAIVTGLVAESTLRRLSTNYGGSGGDRRTKWAVSGREKGSTEGKHRASTQRFPVGKFAIKKCQLIIGNFGCGKTRSSGAGAVQPTRTWELGEAGDNVVIYQVSYRTHFVAKRLNRQRPYN